MSNSLPKELDEARKKGGWPLYDSVTGQIAMVPKKVMRCPECGGVPVPKEASKFKDRTTPEGVQLYICHGCKIEFGQVKKMAYCGKFEQNVLTTHCRICPVGKPFRDKLLKKVSRGEPLDATDVACPHYKGRVGMDWVPEGFDRDTHAKL